MVPGSCKECFDPDAPAFSLTRSYLPTSLSLMLYHTNTHDKDDADSACEVEPLTGDKTQTLPTSITNYCYEFSHHYHSFYDGAYWVCCNWSFSGRFHLIDMLTVVPRVPTIT